MKIGLVSFHKDPNYGTMLQAYALAEALSMQGAEAEYIRYTTSSRPSLLKRMAKGLLQTLGWRRKGEFDFFLTEPFQQTMLAYKQFHEQHIPVSGRMYYANDIGEANQCYDRFMVGSDQTWSPWLNMNPYNIHALPFANHDSKKYAYAPSLGTTHPGSDYVNSLSARIKNFTKLSCRERTNCQLLSSSTGRQVHYVLDPTLLLTPEQWNRIAAPPILERGSYILAYILGEKTEISAFAEKAGKSLGLPVYYLITRPCYLGKKYALDGIGPDQFLTLVRDAALVITDSFHGTVFSINYRVPFYSFNKRKGKGQTQDNDRIMEILKEFDLQERFREDTDTHLCPVDTDYDQVGARLDLLRTESIEYLQGCLGERHQQQ